eukprot:Pgem_evm1s14284
MFFKSSAVYFPYGVIIYLFSMSSFTGTNGEIYNHKKLRAEHLEGVEFATQSDCEVIVHLYEKMGVECVKLLDGMYSFCVANSNT